MSFSFSLQTKFPQNILFLSLPHSYYCLCTSTISLLCSKSLWCLISKFLRWKRLPVDAHFIIPCFVFAPHVATRPQQGWITQKDLQDWTPLFRNLQVAVLGVFDRGLVQSMLISVDGETSIEILGGNLRRKQEPEHAEQHRTLLHLGALALFPFLVPSFRSILPGTTHNIHSLILGLCCRRMRNTRVWIAHGALPSY